MLFEEASANKNVPVNGTEHSRRLSIFRKVMVENFNTTGRNEPSSHGNKRKSFGDVAEQLGPVRRNKSEPTINSQISPTSSINKFRKFGTLALFASRNSGGWKLSNDVMEPSSTLRGRRGTVHGNQISLQGKLLKKRIEMQFIGGGKFRGLPFLLSDTTHKERNEKLAFKFRMWGKIVCYFINLEKQIIESNLNDVLYKRQLKDIDRDAEPVDESMYMTKRINVAYFKADRQRRMSLEGRRILTKSPGNRTQHEIHYATIALQSVETIAELRKDLQRMLATYGYFERFQSKRFIIKQGQRSESYYTIICGKVLIATSGPDDVSASTVHHLKRGDSFGELGIVNRTPRNGSIITEEYTEVLRLSAEDYIKVYMGGGIFDPEKDPLLRSLSPLKGWPLKVLKENPKSFKCNYIQRNKVMDGNVNWIYIVKSVSHARQEMFYFSGAPDQTLALLFYYMPEGSLIVLKKLKKVDPDINPKTGRHFLTAHNDGYLAFRSRNIDYIRYNRFHKLRVPTPNYGLSNDGSDDEFNSSTISGISSLNSLPLLKRLEMVLRPHTALPIVITTPEPEINEGNLKRGSHSAFLTGSRLCQSGKRARLLKDNQSTVSVGCKQINIDTNTPTNNDQIEEKNDNSNNDAPKENVLPEKKVGIRTIFDDMESGDQDTEKVLTEADLNPEFVKIQTLEKGDIFGLQYVIFNDEPQPSLLVVSGGAECIMIKRKLFEAHLSDTQRQRLRTELSPYPTDEVLQERLFIQTNWNQYKHVTLTNIMTEKTQNKPNKHGIKYQPIRH